MQYILVIFQIVFQLFVKDRSGNQADDLLFSFVQGLSKGAPDSDQMLSPVVCQKQEIFANMKRAAFISTKSLSPIP